MHKYNFFAPKTTLNCRGKIINLSAPLVMGILTITPDSFFDGGALTNSESVLKKARLMIAEGADILDLGAASSKPGSPLIDPDTEQQRLMPALTAIKDRFPEITISVDTYHASTAARAVEAGAHIINDISAGHIDEQMMRVAAEYRTPYIMMHMLGTPESMQKNISYNDLIQEIIAYFSNRIELARKFGIHDLIIDPGIGFGKTLEQNYQMLANLHYFQIFELPILLGLSRKSMINKVLDVAPQEALNGTTVLNSIALLQGAHILRVHDVKQAKEAIKIVSQYKAAAAG